MGADAQTTRPARERASAGALQQAIGLLADEARQAKEQQRLPSGKPDIASRFDQTIDPKNLTEALVNRAHRDPFIDAYIRWQLTSFDPPLPEFDDRRFAAFMREVPAMIENPRAETKIVAMFQRIKQAGPLPAADLERLRRMNARLDVRTTVAEMMNTPAEGFHEWAQAKLGDAGPRPRQWLLARCAATIAAGRSTRSIKTKITRDFGASVADRTFTTAQRRLVAEQARRLIGLQRTFINKVTFLADGSVRVTFSTAGVDADDVERWINRLAADKID